MLPKKLEPVTEITAKLFGYELLPSLPPELTWLSRTGLAAKKPPVFFIHDFTGLLWALDALAKEVRLPCIGLQCSAAMLKSCPNMHHLAQSYIRLLPRLPPDAPVQLVAYSLGCRIAYRMACLLEQDGRRVQLVLLDGPCGPESRGPPRMGGMAAAVAERIRERVRGTSRLPRSADADAATEAVEALVDMIASSGAEAAHVAATLLELPDDSDATISLQSPALLVSAAASANLTNGTVEAVLSCLPQLRRETVAGGHFDFLKESTADLAARILEFFAC